MLIALRMHNSLVQDNVLGRTGQKFEWKAKCKSNCTKASAAGEIIIEAK